MIDSFIGRSSVQLRWSNAAPLGRSIFRPSSLAPMIHSIRSYVYRDRYAICRRWILASPNYHARQYRTKSADACATQQASGQDDQRGAYRRWRAAYYGNITLIDEWIGRILDVLERRDLLRNTWIVFISDHGESSLGDHGLWGKTVFYQGSVHVNRSLCDHQMV